MATKNLAGKGVQWVTAADAERPIKIGKLPNEDGWEAKTLPEMLDARVAASPNAVACAVKRDGSWVKYTWSDYARNVNAVAKSLLALGLKRFDGVSVMGFNSPEWYFAAVGGVIAGAIVGGVYTTNGPDACQYQVEHSDSVVVFVENEEHAKKYLKVKDRLPKVVAYVQWSGKVPEEKGWYGWDAFLKVGESVADERLAAAKAAQKPEQCCFLIYTSGTTGMPKAVMISHDNLTWTARIVVKALEFNADDVVISYLPLSHIAAIMTDLMSGIVAGAGSYFAQPDALRGSLGQTLKEVRPTAFLGVPRVWEKIMEAMKAQGKNNTGLKAMIADWAKGLGSVGSYAEQKGEDKPWGWTVAEMLVFNKVKEALGLDRCRFMATAAAPIARETLDYFMSLYLPILEIYGMSESSGPGTISLPKIAHRTGSTGKPMIGSEMKVDQPDKDGNGEICFRGRHVFMGYLKNDEATAETIDADGWLHSGDVGRFDQDNFLYITGRIKELIITAGGENIPPILIEDGIKKAVGQLISNVMVIGDRKKFLTCVVTLATKGNPDAVPGTYQLSDNLTDPAVAIIAAAGGSAKTVPEALKDPVVQKLLDEAIKKANANAISRAQNVQKFAVLHRDFSVETNELTPTLKLKRRIVLQNFSSEIEAMYQE